MKSLSQQDIIDIIYGCAVLGTGGGGSLKDGLELVQQDFDEGRSFQLVPLAEIPDDAWVGTPYLCGAPKVDESEVDAKFARFPKPDEAAEIRSFRALEKYLGQPFYAVASTELGAGNTASALHAAAQLGLPIIDGDAAGRSVPELQHSTYYIKGVPIAPLAVASDFGDVMVLQETYDDFRAEELVRAMAVASDDLVGVTDHPIRGREVRDAVVPDAISYALQLGRILRTAREEGADVAEAIAAGMEGKVLFRGELEKAPWETVDGFNIGEIYLQGRGDFDGESYRIWFKNENIVSWRNNEVDVTAPDLICMFDGKGIPVTTPNFQDKMEMTILALPAPEVWKSEAGVACFGPRHFGFDLEYRPFRR